MGFGTGFGMGSASGGVSDGDKGDVVVSSGGTVFTVESVKGVLYSQVKKTADTGSITSATPADATIGAAGGGTFQLPVTSGHYYKIRVTGVYRSDTATTGFVIGLTTPAITVYSALAHIMVGADGNTGGTQGNLSSSGDTLVGANTPVTNTDTPFLIDGILIPSANGNVTLQIANEAAAGNVTLRQGTILELWDFGT